MTGPDNEIAGFFNRYNAQRVNPPGSRCPHCNAQLPNNDADSAQHQYECWTNEQEAYGPNGRPDPRRML